MLVISKACRIATAVATAAFILGACAATPGPGATKTFHDGSYDDTVFSNILVIVAAGRPDSRALFEWTIATRLTDLGTSATAYYAVVGRNQPVRRGFITDAIRSRGFDAVLLTRPSDPGLAVIDPFEFDYDQLNQLDDIVTSAPLELSTELYSASDQKRVWAIKSKHAGTISLQDLIESHAVQIISQLQKDGFTD